MENNDDYNKEIARWEKSHRRGKIMGGLLIVLAGSLFLARELDADIPQWIFSWKTFLIGLSLVMLVKHGFRRMGWLIPMIVGVAFLVADVYPDFVLKPIIWPLLVILLGLFIIFKPRRKYREHHWRRRHMRRGMDPGCYSAQTESKEDFIDSTSVMGGVTKNILSKNFKGGDITNVFGGTELNLVQADFEGTATLEITQVFGGTKLIIPANWHIQSDIVTVFGSLEDNRPVSPVSGNDSKKVLKLEGFTFFGGIEIKSY